MKNKAKASRQNCHFFIQKLLSFDFNIIDGWDKRCRSFFQEKNLKAAISGSAVLPSIAMKDLLSVTIFLSRAINFFLLIRPANPQKVYYILSKKTDDFNNNLKFRAENPIIIVTQMTANKCIIFLSTLFLAAIPALGKDLEMTKKIGVYEVKISIDKNPPILGDNKIEIEILDSEGIPITDAKVLVNYYMPPMPRMAPMNYKTKTDLKDKKYKAKMKLIMAGPWILAIKISHEKKRFTAKFNIDAR